MIVTSTKSWKEFQVPMPILANIVMCIKEHRIITPDAGMMNVKKMKLRHILVFVKSAQITLCLMRNKRLALIQILVLKTKSKIQISNAKHVRNMNHLMKKKPSVSVQHAQKVKSLLLMQNVRHVLKVVHLERMEKNVS